MIEIISAGVSVGVIYALMAVALVIPFNVNGLYNFATGGIAVLSGLTVYSLLSAGVPPLPAALGGIVLGGLIGGLSGLLYIPVMSKLAPLSMLLLTVGVSMVLEGFGVLIWGPAKVRFESFLPGSLDFGIGRADYYTLLLVGVSAIAGVALWLVFAKTSIGRILRANVLDSWTVRLMGVRPNRLAFGALVVSGAIAGLVGFLITPIVGIGYSDGINLSVIGVVVAIVAGTYSPAGAIVVGVLLGVLESLAAGYLPSGMSSLTSYLVLLVILLVRPQGLFGSPSTRRV